MHRVQQRNRPAQAYSLIPPPSLQTPAPPLSPDPVPCGSSVPGGRCGVSCGLPRASSPQRHDPDRSGLDRETRARPVREFRARFRTSPAFVAQGIEHRSPKAGVAGSNPAGGTTRYRSDLGFIPQEGALFGLGLLVRGRLRERMGRQAPIFPPTDQHHLARAPGRAPPSRRARAPLRGPFPHPWVRKRCHPMQPVLCSRRARLLPEETILTQLGSMQVQRWEFMDRRCQLRSRTPRSS
jgi:hypothetical protein